MKKRSKIIVSIVASVMCLGFFAYGVYAAITASFALNASFNFDALGVYVGISGQVYTGTSRDAADLKALSGNGYNLSEQKNFTTLANGLPDESKSFDKIRTWQPANVSMDENAPVLVYEVTIKNYSSKPISVFPINKTQPITGVTIWSADSAFSIPCGESRSYRLILTVTNVLTELNKEPISVDFLIDQDRS